MVIFEKKVDTGNRSEMIQFLKNHFRYDTMNSWNRLTSYANNVKIYNLELTKEQEDALWDIINIDDVYEQYINPILEKFGKKHNYRWQAGFNGKNGGYIVLYTGGTKQSEHKSYCTVCGQKNFSSVKETGTRCGRCGNDARVDYKTPPKIVYTNMQGTDDDADFSDWSDDELASRVKIVCDFDRMCDEVVKEAVWLTEHCKVEQEEYTVTKTRDVLVACD